MCPIVKPALFTLLVKRTCSIVRALPCSNCYFIQSLRDTSSGRRQVWKGERTAERELGRNGRRCNLILQPVIMECLLYAKESGLCLVTDRRAGNNFLKEYKRLYSF